MGRCPAGHPLSGAASELRRNTRASGETEGGNQAQAAASAGAAHQPPSEQRAMEMVACGKRGIQKQASSSSHDSLEISQTARDSPIPTAPTTDSRMGEAKTRIGNCWAVENWKSKSGIPTFPPPRQPAAARKKPFTEQKPGPSPTAQKRGHFYRGNTGDISNEA
jgi:hypothetical protein